MNFKKILLGLGAIAAVAVPTVAVVSCGDEDDAKTVTLDLSVGSVDLGFAIADAEKALTSWNDTTVKIIVKEDSKDDKTFVFDKTKSAASLNEELSKLKTALGDKQGILEDLQFQD